MTRILRMAQRVEKCSAVVGCGCLMALMLIVTADVGFRYVANTPFMWSHELIVLYLMPAIFFLTLSDSYRAGAQVNVDILHGAFPPPLRRFADGVGALVSLFVFTLVVHGGWQRGLESWRNDEVLAGAIPWPVWPSALLVVLGGAMLTLRLVATLARAVLGTEGEAAAAGHPAGGGFE